MKSFQLITTLFALTIFSSTTTAVQVSIADATNQPPQCGYENHPFLKPGECGHVPKGTLSVTVTLDDSEKLEMLDNVHVVIENNGEYFQYKTLGGSGWEAIKIDGLTTSPEFKTSYNRFPPNSPFRFSTREVYLGEFYEEGTKVFVGVRANDTAGFVEGSIKEAFIVQ